MIESGYKLKLLVYRFHVYNHDAMLLGRNFWELTENNPHFMLLRGFLVCFKYNLINVAYFLIDSQYLSQTESDSWT